MQSRARRTSEDESDTDGGRANAGWRTDGSWSKMRVGTPDEESTRLRGRPALV